jgi:hypothetical protein
MPAKLNFFKTPASERLVSSQSVSTSTGISGCFQPGQAKVGPGPTPLGVIDQMDRVGSPGLTLQSSFSFLKVENLTAFQLHTIKDTHSLEGPLKGTLSRDFLLLVFFLNQFPPSF